MTRSNTLMRLAAAAVVSATLGFPAAAQTGPRVVGSGENASLEYDRPSENVVGGALTRQVGTGEGASTEVLAVVRANPGRPSRMVGSGESAEAVLPEALPSVMFTGARGAR